MKQSYLARAVLAAVAACSLSHVAFARGGKEFISQDYRFDRPVSGYEGRAGNYYCSYQRHPNRTCATDARGNEKCQVKGWTLRQYCY
ncbi:MAG TPA: hypothetical protein VFF87_07365 [Hyphomicrobium sp.]|nr:hypothetical protein [Hyphomicrobium sp.]